MTKAIAYPPIWFTSGTPHRLGQRECAYERWLAYHAGPHGTGYRRKRTAIPLATGAAVHDGIGMLCEWMLEWQTAKPTERRLTVPDEVTAWAASEAASAYEKQATEKGLELTKGDSDAEAAVTQLILEQRTLIEGLIWIYAIARMPVMLSMARLVCVEQEEGPIVRCTCGLGDWVGQWSDHLPRGCTGICAQGRADMIWEMIEDVPGAANTRGTLVYEEIKTKSSPNYGWEQQWEHSQQLWLNMEAASKRLGTPVTQAFVPILYKGKRQGKRGDPTSPKLQQSALCWPWFDPGSPPVRPMEWASRFKWYDEAGKGHTLPRTFMRVAVWDVEHPLPAANPNGWPGREGASRVEQWVRGWIPTSQWSEFLQVLGPFPKPTLLVEEAEKSLVTEESSWRNAVLYLRGLGIYHPHESATIIDNQTQQPVEITAADVITRSWACTKFDSTPCAFKRVCLKEPGWEQMAEGDDYEIRTPHHTIEKEAMTETIEALGLGWTDPEDEAEVS